MPRSSRNPYSPRKISFKAFLRKYGHGITFEKAVNDRVYTEVNGTCPTKPNDQVDVYDDMELNNWVIAEPLAH